MTQERSDQIAIEKDHNTALTLLREASEKRWEPAVSLYPLIEKSNVVLPQALPVYDFDDLYEKLVSEHDKSYYYRGQTRFFGFPLWPSGYRALGHSTHTIEYNGEYRLRNAGTQFHMRRETRRHNGKPGSREWQLRRAMSLFVRNAFGYPLTEAFSQQAGFESEGLDITADVDVSFFFACHSYADGKYSLSNEPGPSVIYRWRLPDKPWGWDQVATYDFYTCPTLIPTERLIDQFETCATWGEFQESIEAYRNAIDWSISAFNLTKVRTRRPLNLIRVPKQLKESSRIRKQRAALLLPDIVLSLAHTQSPFCAKAPIIHPSLPLDMIEDLSQSSTCEVFLFTPQPTRAAAALAKMRPEEMFGEFDVTHGLLHGWMESLFHEYFAVGTPVIGDLPFNVTVQDLVEYSQRMRRSGELFF